MATQYPEMVAEGQPAVSSFMWALAKKHPEEFLEDPQDPSSVVRFTDLRKLALNGLAQRCGYPDPQQVAEAAFQAWHDARHDVDELFLPGALELLQALKSKGLRLCAVTNGNCDINQIAAFEGVFEFCINAEKVGARKRTGRPYAAALKKAGVADDVGGRWVHIGDDFTEDIVAAKNDFKLRTIWLNTAERKAKVEREEQEKGRQASAAAAASAKEDSSGGKNDGGSASTTSPPPPGLGSLAAMALDTKDRFFKDKGTLHINTMDTDDYLTHFIVKEFADAEVETLQEIVHVIEGWLQQHREVAGQELSSAGGPSLASAAAAVARATPVEKPASKAAEETKFCIACGEKILKRAKFCSSCGESQE